MTVRTPSEPNGGRQRGGEARPSNPARPSKEGGASDLSILWQDGERVLRRESRLGVDGTRSVVLVVAPAAAHPAPTFLERLAHEYGLKEELEPAWAVRPLELVRERGTMLLVLEDPGGEPLEWVVGAPMEMGTFLRLASGIAATLGKSVGGLKLRRAGPGCDASPMERQDERARLLPPC
jgi:hypothetical protein